jgi:hypothetical protein
MRERAIAAFVELHIEQGAVLDESRTDISRRSTDGALGSPAEWMARHRSLAWIDELD